MRFIDTRNPLALEDSVCHILQLSSVDLSRFFHKLLVKHCHNKTDVLQQIFDFVKNRLPESTVIEELLLFKIHPLASCQTIFPHLGAFMGSKIVPLLEDTHFNGSNFLTTCLMVTEEKGDDFASLLKENDHVYLKPQEIQGSQNRFYLFGPTKNQMACIDQVNQWLPDKREMVIGCHAYRIPLSQVMLVGSSYRDYNEIGQYFLNLCVYYLFLNHTGVEPVFFTKERYLLLNLRDMYDSQGKMQVIRDDLRKKLRHQLPDNRNFRSRTNYYQIRGGKDW